MKDIKMTVSANKRIADRTYELILAHGEELDFIPGQFVNVLLPGFYLRRPFSVADWSDGSLTIVYKTVGAGTEAMTGLSEGAELDVLAPLGNGFDISAAGARPLLIGGGAGVAPMLGLARTMTEAGLRPTAILGFNTASEVFYEERFKAMECEVSVTTVDGSLGIRGFVTAAIEAVDATFAYACGPEPMLKAVYNATYLDGEYSFEARMGCGFGACMGCTRKTVGGYKRVCKDGPVFRKGEIVWE